MIMINTGHLRSAFSYSLWVLLLILLVGGIASTGFFEKPPAGTDWAPPTMLAVSALLVLMYFGLRGVVGLIVGGLIGFGAELIGVSTGFPFGGYEYTNVLGWSILKVPIVLIAAWILVISFTACTASMLKLRFRASMVFAPFFLVIIDLCLEPVATGSLNAWSWHSSALEYAYYGVPLTNFVGWFLVGFLAFLPVVGTVPRQIFFAFLPGALVIAFFVVVNLLEGHTFGALSGFTVLVIGVYGLLRRNRNILSG